MCAEAGEQCRDDGCNELQHGLDGSLSRVVHSSFFIPWEVITQSYRIQGSLRSKSFKNLI